MLKRALLLGQTVIAYRANVRKRLRDQKFEISLRVLMSQNVFSQIGVANPLKD